MFHEAHVWPQPVICGRQLSKQLWRQLVEVQCPLWEEEPAGAPKYGAIDEGERDALHNRAFGQIITPDSVLRHATVRIPVQAMLPSTTELLVNQEVLSLML